MPHVAVDASNLMLEPKTGIVRYLSNFLPALAEVAPELRITAWMGFVRAVHDGGYPVWTQGNLRRRALRIPRRFIERAWTRGLLHAEFLTPGAQVFHSFWNHLPPASRCRRVLTVFDIRELRFPELYPGEVDRVRELLERNIAASDVVVTGSHAVARELRDYFPLGDRPVEVVYGAVDETFRPRAEVEVEETLGRLGIKRPYLVTMGSGDPRKNIPRLIRAFATYTGTAGDPLDLVVTGRYHPAYRAAFEALERGGASDRVKYVGMVDDDDWCRLLTGAEAMMYPSLYEGFGLPPLEAMACGTPVLAADIGAVREVAGDAACFFEPADCGSMVETIARFRADAGLTRRLRQAGSKRAVQFTWEQVARDYLRIYRQAGAV